MHLVAAFTFLSLLQLLLAEVIVLKTVQSLYDHAPKLLIRGSGFGTDPHEIRLEIGVMGQPPLMADKDFMITMDANGDGLALMLLANRR